MFISRYKEYEYAKHSVSGYSFIRTGYRRTTGIYGHLPKYYKCKGPLEDFDGECETCPKPNWHLSYPGYLALVTSKGRLYFYYWGKEFYSGKYRRFRWSKNVRAQA